MFVKENRFNVSIYFGAAIIWCELCVLISLLPLACFLHIQQLSTTKGLTLLWRQPNHPVKNLLEMN